jgi:uncharacterized protein YabE (DUF348 family)
MDSGRKAWAVPDLLANNVPRTRTSILIIIVSLCFVLIVGMAVMAKPVLVEVDGKVINYITFRTNVGSFLEHSKLNVYPEDLAIPARETPVKRGIKISLTRSVPINIKLDGRDLTFRTLNLIVGQALEEANKKYDLHLKDSDEVEPTRDKAVSLDLVVDVKRSVPLTITADGSTTSVEMAPRSVKDILAKKNISIGEKDRVTPEPSQIVTANTNIKVVRVVEKNEKVKSNLPFQVIAKSGDFPVGLPDKVLTKGSKGLEEQLVRVTYEDGKEVDRAVLSQKIINKPVDQVVARGSQTTVSRGGQVINFKRAIMVRATAYCLPGGTTSVGESVRRGVVAVDPGVIPYYSKLWIEGYGSGAALDTGGAIKGNRIDLYFESLEQAYSWGSRNVIVYVM